jgi:UDP-N-acetylmuramate dehydrogenase
MAEPQNVEQLVALVDYLRDGGIPHMVLGAGTNVLFHDAGFRGVVVRMNALQDFDAQTNGSGHGRITVAAGVPLPSVIAKACELGWTGMEPLWGIPGSFGGAVVSNAGAGAVCMGELLFRIELLMDTGHQAFLKKEEIRYAYRSLELPKAAVVLGGTLKLDRDDPASIKAKLERAKSLRRGAQPGKLPSAGCVFKNPTPDNPAGAIIDRLGLKGAAVGDAQVSERHANFIVNRGKAKSLDVMELVGKIRERVRQEEQVELELEICVIGETADA